MGKRVTIRDIAEEAGVSTGTVHRAIYGKKGVGTDIQQKILEICVQRGYQMNSVASALKRTPLRVVGAFPVPDGKGRFFYSHVWQGFRRAIDEVRDYNVDAVEVFYWQGTDHDQNEELRTCFDRYHGEIDALVTIGHSSQASREALRMYVEHNIPVFLACDDIPDCGRINCVQANYDMTGRMVAELLTSQIPERSTILLCCGDISIPSHYQTVSGFEHYVQENHLKSMILKLYGYDDEFDLRERMRAELKRNSEIRGAFSVSARLSVLLAEEITATEKQDDIRIVASDLFDETIQNMERGIVKNIVYKRPEEQAYCAAKQMSNYLLKGQRPSVDVQYIESCIIFRSNLDMYRQQEHRCSSNNTNGSALLFSRRSSTLL